MILIAKPTVKQHFGLVCLRYLYIGSNAIYPSPHWAGKQNMIDFQYDEVINPMMISGGLAQDQAAKMEQMLTEQGQILQHGMVAHLLNPLSQNVKQFLFGLNYSEQSKLKLIECLEALDLLNSDGSLHNIKYTKALRSLSYAEKFKSEFSKDPILEKNFKTVISSLNGMSSNAMDTIYFANMWLYLGISEFLSGRPVTILQTPKYSTRQIERYYGIITSMVFGLTPILIGGPNKIYNFEGMADLAPTIDKNGNLLAICAHSSRSDPKCYENLNQIHTRLAIKDPLPKVCLVEVQDNYKELIYHLDLGIHVDEDQNVYVAENLLTEQSHSQLMDVIGKSRIIYVPENEWKLYAMNFILFDSRFKASQRTAIARDDCPVLYTQLEKNGYQVFKRQEMFLNGGGSARCRVAFFEKGCRSHTLETFLEEQAKIEDTLGTNYAVVPRNKVEEFCSVYDPMDLQRIVFNNQPVKF